MTPKKDKKRNSETHPVKWRTRKWSETLETLSKVM